MPKAEAQECPIPQNTLPQQYRVCRRGGRGGYGQPLAT